MAELSGDGGSLETRTLEVELLGRSNIESEEIANNFICYSHDFKRNTMESNLFNTRMGPPVIHEYSSKNMINGKKCTEIK